MFDRSPSHPVVTAATTFALFAATVGCAHAASTKAQELKVYKQRVAVTAEVHCGGYERIVTSCTADVHEPLMEKITPVLLLRYTGLVIRGTEIKLDTEPTGEPLRFPADRVNYSGTQNLEVEVIYLK